MKKRGLLLALGLAAVLVCAAAPQAKAEVLVGVAVGTPVYVRPTQPYGYFAPRPYVAYRPVRFYRRAYVAPAPVYYRHWRPRRYYVARRCWR